MADKDPILSYIYNTKEEATKASKRLGCDGYRTYIIDGVKKYVPCATVEEFERVFRIRVVQGKIVGSGSETNSSKLVGNQFASNTDDTDALFTLGNFNISTFTPQKIDKAFNLPDSTKLLSANQLANRSTSDFNRRLGDGTVRLNPDYTNFESYVSYGSLTEKIRTSLQYFTEQFPAAMVLRGGNSYKPLVRDYEYDVFENTATFSVNSTYMFNPFEIIYASSGNTTTLDESVSEYRNFTKKYKDYVLKVDGIAYPIIDYRPSVNNETDGIITVEGDPFNTTTLNSKYYNKSYLIAPNKNIVNDFFKNLTDFGKFLLNRKSRPAYTSKFRVPFEDENGDIVFKEKVVTLPTSDSHNIDLFSDEFDRYTTDLYEIASEFDEFKTNLVARFYTTDAFKEYDTEDKKIEKVLHLYGRQFDEVKKYIDGIANMTRVSYDKIGNIPDLLVKNFARTLGWKTFEIENADTIIQNLFKIEEEELDENDITLGELDIELWRRLVINSSYLFKSKGTRKSIEFLLKLVGVPEAIIEINEYIHLAEKKLDYSEVSEAVINPQNYPIDRNGYPTVPTDTYFQSNGGTIFSDSENLGPYDNGKEYLSKYTKFGEYYAFDVYKTKDNLKSWVFTNTETERVNNTLNRDVDYTLPHSDLIINTKEADVFISLDRVFDTAAYRHYNRNVININSDLSPAYTKETQVSQISFNQFLRETLDNYINVRNRKTITTYPTLSKIYYDYQALVENESKTYIEYSNALDFLNRFDTYWIKLVRDFIPATTILTAGKKIQNSQFLDSKHVHKRGTNKDINWLGTDGSEFQDKALKPVYNGSRVALINQGIRRKNNLFENGPFSIAGFLNNNNEGYLERSAYYDAYYYGFYDFCTFTENLLPESVMGYGRFSGLYDNLIQRDMAVVFGFTPSLNTSGITFYSSPIQPPSTYNGDILVGNQNLSGNYNTEYFSVVKSTEINLTTTLDGESVKITTNKISSVGAYTKAIYFKMSDITLDVGVTYTLKYNYNATLKTFSGTPNFGLFLQNASGVTSSTTVLDNNWKQVDVNFTATGSNVDFYFVSETGIPDEDSVIYLDSFTLLEKPDDSFERAYETIDVDFICPPPLPHACYAPVVGSALPVDIPIDKLVQYDISFTLDSDWNQVDTDPLNGITFAQQLLTISGPNGLRIRTTNDSNAGKRKLIYINNQSVTSGSNYYFEFNIETENDSVLQHTIQPVLVYDSTEDLADAILYPESFTGESRLFGEFKASSINTNLTYRFGLLITAGEAHSEYLTNLKLIEKNVYKSQNISYVINQPINYGFSQSTGVNEPSNAEGGSTTDWLVPYITLTGDTINTNDVKGPYETIDERSSADPLMHVRNSLVRRVVPEVSDEYFEINLSDKTLLGYVFFDKDNPSESISPENGEVEGQIYQSDSVNITFDGLYPINETLVNGGPGPDYDIKVNTYEDNVGVDTDYETRSLYFQLYDNYTCAVNSTTRLMLVNNFNNVTGSTFPDSSDDASLISDSTGGFIVSNTYSKLRFEVKLIFDSDFDFNQDIVVKLVDDNNAVYVEETFTVSGPDNPNFESVDSRVIKFTKDIFVRQNDNVYLAVEPQDADCRILISEDEEITDYPFILKSPSNNPVTNGFYGNFSYISGVTFDDDRFESGFMKFDEYTEIILTISERPDVNFPEALKTFNGYLVSYGVDYTSSPNPIWTEDTDEILISTEPVNRVDFYPYVENNTFNPLYADKINGQSMFDFIDEYKAPLFDGYSYSYTDDNNIVQTVSGDSLSGNTITLRKFSGVKVYESTVVTINEAIKNNLIAFDTDFSMRKQFKGFNNGIGVEYAQELFYNATDTNTNERFKYGSASFITKRNGVYLRYRYERDNAGYQRTGEFIGKLNVRDVCGNRATIYLLTLIDLDTSEKPNITLQPQGPTVDNTGGGGISGNESPPELGVGEIILGGGIIGTLTTRPISVDIEGLNGGAGSVIITGDATKSYSVNGDTTLDTFIVNNGDSVVVEVTYNVGNGNSLLLFTVNGTPVSSKQTKVGPFGSLIYKKTITLSNITTPQNIVVKFEGV